MSAKAKRFKGFIDGIVEKIKNCEVSFTSLNSKRYFKGLEPVGLDKIKFKDGDYVFSEKEIAALVSVCPKSCANWCEFVIQKQRENELGHMLRESVMDKFRTPPKHNLLAHAPVNERVMGLMNERCFDGRG